MRFLKWLFRRKGKRIPTIFENDMIISRVFVGDIEITVTKKV